MKMRILLPVLLLATLVITNSCKEDNLVSTEFTITLKQDFTVHVIYDTIFVIDTLLDATALSSDLEKYKDNIEEVSLTKVTYMLTAFDGDATHQLMEGSVGIAGPSDTTASTLAVLNNVNLQTLVNNETELTLNQSTVSQLNNLVKNSPNQFRFITQGSINKKPVTFTVRFRFNFKIKAGIL